MGGFSWVILATILAIHRLCTDHIYSATLNSGIKERCEFRKNLTLAGIKISLIELRSCELFQELALAGIKVDGSKENHQNSF